MQSMCGSTWPPKLIRAAYVALGMIASLGCSRQVGYVGRKLAIRQDAGVATYSSDFQHNDGDWEIVLGLPRATVDFARPDALADDNSVVEISFPGNRTLGPTDGSGPDWVTQMSSVSQFHFGTLRTKVRFGTCSRTESVVQAVLGYFNDGSDANGNGIVDDEEIDFQLSCGAPNYALLSVFTDYEEAAAGPRFRKLSHIVDFSTGAEYDTPSDSSDDFVESGRNAKLVRPNLIGTDSFHELGFDWRSDSVRFFLVDGTEELTLWTLSDASKVPQRPIHIMYNLWHPSSHWFPQTGEAGFPANDVVMKVDWVTFAPFAPDAGN